MLTLRLTQTSLGADRHRVQLDLEGDGAPFAAESDFPFTLSDQDREDLRWYLEDYLEYPIDPAPTIAERIEQRLTEVGTQLFRGLFASDGARNLWGSIRDQLAEIRVEVSSQVEAAAVLPWELLREPGSDVPVALRAGAFVRVQRQAAQRPQLPQVTGDTIRVLLVICRPAGDEDVPFQSVASHLVR